MAEEQHNSSFRDPSGFIFEREGLIYRQVNKIYAQIFDQLVETGLFDELIAHGQLLAHELSTAPPPLPEIAHVVLKPNQLERISYHFEWSFSQLRDAALLTLDILSLSLKKNFILKDASSFNVQFVGSKPIFIDTLSFDRYKENQAWMAYRQFCQHFLAPLALRSHISDEIHGLFNANIDGIPLGIASSLLPTKTKFSPGLQMHIHMHAKSLKQASANIDIDTADNRKVVLPKKKLEALIASLRDCVKSLKPRSASKEWAKYYDNTNYTDQAAGAKLELVVAWTKSTSPRTVLDLGGNTGRFSEAVLDHVDQVTCVDGDAAAIELLYRKHRKKSSKILPLVVDLSNPCPAFGFDGKERDSFADRFQSDLSLCLALVHHLAIGNNIPFSKIAEFFSAFSHHLIIEWIPKQDSRVQFLLSSREDIFDNYTEANFVEAFSAYFTIEKTESVIGSKRKMFLMRRKLV